MRSRLVRELRSACAKAAHGILCASFVLVAGAIPAAAAVLQDLSHNNTYTPQAYYEAPLPLPESSPLPAFTAPSHQGAMGQAYTLHSFQTLQANVAGAAAAIAKWQQKIHTIFQKIVALFQSRSGAKTPPYVTPSKNAPPFSVNTGSASLDQPDPQAQVAQAAAPLRATIILNTPVATTIATTTSKRTAPVSTVVPRPLPSPIIVQGISESAVRALLLDWQRTLSAQIAQSTDVNISSQLAGIYKMVSQMNNITQLSNVTINNATINSSTLSGSSGGGGGITSGSDATLGNLTVTSLSSSGTATSTLAGGLQATALNLTATAASSTYASGINLSGGCFAINGTCIAIAGNGSPGGIDGQVQFNSAGSFGANANFTFIPAANRLTITNASTTNFTAAYASTTNLVASNSLTVGTLSGFLKAVAGVVSTALVNLASDVTGVLPVANGGTGWANIAASALLYGNGSGALATTTAATPGQILAYLNGVPTWTSTSTFATTGTANTWNTLQTFSQGLLSQASSTVIGLATLAGGATTTNLTTTGIEYIGTASTTNLTVSSIKNSLLSTNATGIVSGTSSLTVSFGGTGSTTLGGLLMGGGVGAITSAIVSSPLLFSGSTLSISQSNGGTNGYLGSSDWTNFNNKVSSTSLSASFPLAYNNSTGAFSYLGLGTSSAPIIGNLAYWTAANSLGTVATTSATCSGSVSCSSFNVLGSSPITISGSALGGDPFTHVSVYGQVTSATSTLLAFTGSPFSIVASIDGKLRKRFNNQPHDIQRRVALSSFDSQLPAPRNEWRRGDRGNDFYRREFPFGRRRSCKRRNGFHDARRTSDR
jgi:hypothetical protein